ncbi:hypothetical protein wVul_1769 [Wolbachia endosymbiont of Armadillidium vulgare str. wVulC]|nr:hypothetical protein wVul_1769 [Wolbachia endosymbiont of Armadillidium vulgare str. wVulC]
MLVSVKFHYIVKKLLPHILNLIIIRDILRAQIYLQTF